MKIKKVAKISFLVAISYLLVVECRYLPKRSVIEKQNIETSINVQVDENNSEIDLKREIEGVSILCGLSTIICEYEKYDEVTYKIKQVAETYNIDWKLAVAIARLETGNYTSYLFVNKNNVGGNYVDGKFKDFKTLDDGIEYFISNLKRVYIDKGLDTPKKIQPVYAPKNAKNDPNNLNSNWTNSVEAIYESLS